MLYASRRAATNSAWLHRSPLRAALPEALPPPGANLQSTNAAYRKSGHIDLRYAA